MSLRTALLLTAATASLFAASCRRGGPGKPAANELPLRPAAEARVDLVTEVLVPDPSHTLDGVGAVAKSLGLPVGGPELRGMITERLPLPPGAAEKIDLAKPLVLSLLAAPRIGTGPGAGADGGPPDGAAAAGADKTNVQTVLAFALKDPTRAGFDAWVRAMGRPAETNQDAVRLAPADGGTMTGWLLHRRGAVCAAETLTVLTAGCGLALEARRANAADLLVTVLPDGIARAAGTTVPDALAKARAAMREQQANALAAGSVAGGTPVSPATMKLADAVMGPMFNAAGEVAEGRFALSVDAQKGLTAQGELVPRKGTELAKLFAVRQAYTVDPALLEGPAPAALWAGGSMDVWSKLFAVVRAPLLEMVPEGDRARLGIAMDTFTAALKGPWTMRVGLQAGREMQVSYETSYHLAPGADGNALLTTMENMVRDKAVLRLLDSAMGGIVKFKLSERREGDALVTTTTLDTKGLPREQRAQLAGVPFFSGKPVEARTAVAGGRLLTVIGPDSKQRLARLTGPAPAAAAPAAALTAALADTKGADGVYYSDLGALVRGAVQSVQATLPKGRRASHGADAGVTAILAALGPALADLQLATWASYQGGEALRLTWRVPIETFQSGANVARMVMGAAAGAAQP